MENENKTRIPVYLDWNTKLELEQLKYELWKETGQSIALSKFLREAIEDQLVNHRTDLVEKYLRGQ